MALTIFGSATNLQSQTERLKVEIPAPFPLTYRIPDALYRHWGVQKAKAGGLTDTGFSGRDMSLSLMVNSKDVRSGKAMVHMFRRGKISPASIRACVYSEIIRDHPGAFAAYTKELEGMSTKWAKEIVGYTGKHTPLEKWKWLPKTVLAIVGWHDMNVYLHNLRLTSRQQALQAQGFGPKMSQALQSSADDAENEYSHTKKKWIASIDSAIAAQRAIIGTDKQKDDDQEFLKQLEEQRTQILAIDPIPAATDNYKQYYADMNSADVDQLWNSNFGLRQAYMMYDCLSSMIVIEENFNELYMKILMTETWTQVCRATWDHFVSPHQKQEPKDPGKILEALQNVDAKFKTVPGFPQEMGEVYVIRPFCKKGVKSSDKKRARNDAREKHLGINQDRYSFSFLDDDDF